MNVGLVLVLMAIAALIIYKLKGKTKSKAPVQRTVLDSKAKPPSSDQVAVSQDAALVLKIEVVGAKDNSTKTEQPTEDRDAWEDWADDAYDPYRSGRILKVPLLLEYCDKKGAVTRRNVVTERYVYDASDGLIHAFCKLRNARRPFRISRITKAIDLETGEEIADLRTWLDSQYESTNEFRLDQFVEQHTPALGLCQAMAKADGAFRAKEKELVAGMCVQLGASEQVADLVVKALLEWQVPSAVRVGKDIRALVLQSEAEQQLVLETLRQIIESDKTEREEERRLLDKVEKAIRTRSA